MKQASFYARRTTKLSFLLAAVLVGLALAKLIQPLPVLLGAASLVFAIGANKRRPIVAIACLVVFGVCAGLWRGVLFAERLAPYTTLSGQKIMVSAVADTGGSYGDNGQLEFDVSHIKVLQPYEVDLPGRMVVSGYGENSILKGDAVIIEGKVHKRRGGRQAGMSYAQITATSRSASKLEDLRRRFLAGLATALPEPHDQFAAGLLVGQKSELKDTVVETLRIVGLSHVIAVSGYNLTIMADVARKRFGKNSKFRSTALSILLVLSFVALAGSSASIARAAFVSVLSIVAAHYGRSVKPLLLLLLAACWTAYANPLNVWVDIGWYLSFLAFFGVLIVAPAVQNRLYTKDRQPNAVTKIVIETVSAQLVTLPLTMYIFGQVSLISLLANVMIVPLVPLAMLLSLFAGIAGILVPLSASVVAWPARVLLDFMLSASSLLSRVPHALENASLSTEMMAAAYTVIILLVLVLRQKAKGSATITE